MDVGEGAATGTLLLDAGGPGGLAQHPALSNEDDMAVGELLLELTGQPAECVCVRSAPQSPRLARRTADPYEN